MCVCVRVCVCVISHSALISMCVFYQSLDKAATSLNRLGVRSESSGALRFRCNVVVADPRTKASFAEAAEQAQVG